MKRQRTIRLADRIAIFPSLEMLHFERSHKGQRTASRLRDSIEKDTIIRALRIELAEVKAENERMRMVLMPLGSPAGQMYAAKFGKVSHCSTSR